MATIAAPILALFVGAALDRILERKARLIAYYGHASVFRLTNPPNATIHTHSVVIKNTGRKPATDIRISHNFLPDNFNLFPDVEFTRVNLPGGGAEIRIPILVPGEQITISYLYFPPITYAQINASVRHAEGFARGITVVPTPQAAPWLARIAWALLFIGAVAVIYVGFHLALFVIARLRA